MLKYFFITLFCLALSTGSVLAQSPSPDSSPTPETTQETTQKLKERIERVVEEKREQIKGVLTELSKRKKGFVGEVQRVSENSITVKTRNATQIIPITEAVTITKQNKKIAISEIAVGDWAVVIGGFKDDEFQPERLSISATTLLPSPQIVTMGSIDEIVRTKIVVTPRANPDKKEFVTTKNTQYQSSSGDAIKATELSADLQVLIVAQETTAGNEIKIIRLLAPLANDTDS